LADIEKRKDEIKHALSSEEIPGLKRMLEAAACEPTILASAEKFDDDPYRLNCQNGILNLTSGELIPHTPDICITRIANVTYDAAAEAPLWRACLERILPEPLRAYLQRWMGYMLTGNADAQAMLFLLGDGGNGKSTVTIPPHRIMGEYAQTVPASSIIRQQKDGIRNDLAGLQGIRYALISEYPENKPLDEAFVKSATGGESIRARYLYHESFEFRPEFKPVVMTNNKPIILGTDWGIWRRVKLIPFHKRIENPEDGLRDRLFETEAPGILNWMLRGCLEWRQSGLKEPPEVTAAVQEYRNDMDIIGQFLNECTERAISAETPSKAIYEAYGAWAVANGYKRKSAKSFGMELGKRYTQIHKMDGSYYENIILRPEANSAL
jgi:putative DNA primase/helicase